MSKTNRSVCPYKGLVPYSEEDAPFFFGRDRTREIISSNLIASRLTLLHGPSGVGKSSVLRAGVSVHLRKVAQQYISEDRTPEFAVAVFNSWRDDPVAGLVQRVQDSVAMVSGGKTLAPLTPSRDLSRSLQTWTRLNPNSRRPDLDLLIILDQFEEYFLYHPKESGEGTFAGELARAINNPELRANFLIAMRDDALAKLERFKGSIPYLFENRLSLYHLDQEAAREAITKPIEQYNLIHSDGGEPFRIEPALVEAVLEQLKTGQVVIGQMGRGSVSDSNDDGGGDGSSSESTYIETPFLQMVMTRLWCEEVNLGSRVLRLDTLNRLGGAARIVRTHLDKTMSKLPPEEQDTASRIFYHLVTPSGTKITHKLPDLADFAGLPKEPPDPTLVNLLSKLASNPGRILRPVEPPPDQQNVQRYEIFHDVLAPAILDWRARYMQQKKEAEATKRAAEEAAEREKEKTQILKLQQAEALAEAKRQRIRQMRFALIGLVILAIASIAMAAIAASQRTAARKEQSIAKSRELAVNAILELPADAELSVLLASEAVKGARTDQAEDALKQAIVESQIRVGMYGHKGVVFKAAFSPDGNSIVTASSGHTARVWDANTGNLISVLAGHAGPVNTASFSPDGKSIVTTSDDTTARVWNAKTGEVIHILTYHTSPVRVAIFSPDGKYIAMESDDSSGSIWDARTGQKLTTLQGLTGPVAVIAFSPDGERLVTEGGERDAKVWDTKTGRELFTLSGHEKAISAISFSDDGKLIVTASHDNTARVWDARTGRTIGKPLHGHTQQVNSASFSPDGKRIVTASDDDTALIWEAAPDWATDVNLIGVLKGHKRDINIAVFSRDGRYIVTASVDQTARVWHVDTKQVVSELRGHTGPVNSAAFSLDGERILTSGDTSARIWQAKRSIEFRGHTAPVQSVSFSDDGKTLVTTSDDKTMRAWDALSGEEYVSRKINQTASTAEVSSPDGKLLVLINEKDKTKASVKDASTNRELFTLEGHTQQINSIAFSLDSRRIVTASGIFSISKTGARIQGGDNTARIWDATTGKELFKLEGHTDRVWSARFSPDGKLIVTASDDNTARVWDIDTHKELIVLTGHTGSVRSAVFSQNGKWIATASYDNTARVWDAQTGRTIIIGRHPDAVFSVAFSPDGKRLATAGKDKTARIFDASVCDTIDNIVALANQRVTRKLTEEEKNKYLSNGVTKN